MNLQLTASPLDLRLRDSFRIARGTQTVAENVLVEIRYGDRTGRGEAAPSPFYGESRATVLAILPRLAEVLGPDPFAIQAAWRGMARMIGGNFAAKAAVETALFDLVAQLADQPHWRLWGLDAAACPPTSFTIGLDTPERMAEKARAATEFPILKVKVGVADDVARVRAVRAARPEAMLRLDANGGWNPKEAVRRLNELAPLGIELIEQPVEATDYDGLRFVREHAPMPVFADESCVRLEDVPRLAGRVDGIVVKLAKCGGLRPARAIMSAAHAHDLRCMLGCMIESSLGISALANLAPNADLCDLDGHLLIDDDPFVGVTVEQGRLTLSDQPGLGAKPRR
jgi:L-alanine-DL-glutamate epimerase-like enolase superfamily enzyme